MWWIWVAVEDVVDLFESCIDPQGCQTQRIIDHIRGSQYLNKGAGQLKDTSHWMRGIPPEYRIAHSESFGTW